MLPLYADIQESNARVALRELALVAPGGPAAPLPRVGGRYGAPMGRPSYTLDAQEAAMVQRVTLDTGGYDAGGAYWGIGAPLWRVIGQETGATEYTRAPDSRAALDVARGASA